MGARRLGLEAGEPVARHVLLACLLLATGGERVLPAGPGLYRYRHSVLPGVEPHRRSPDREVGVAHWAAGTQT